MENAAYSKTSAVTLQGYGQSANACVAPRDQTSMENICSRVHAGNSELAITIDRLLQLEGRMCGGVGTGKPESPARPQPSGHIHEIIYGLDEMTEKHTIISSIIQRLQSII